MSRRIFILSLILSIILTSNYGVNAQANTYRYVYLTQAQKGRLDFHAVDPANVSQVIDLYSLTLPFPYDFSQALPSPNGRYIALILDNITTRQYAIWLVDAASGQYQPIIETDIQRFDAHEVRIKYAQPVIWSPDSRSLAILVTKQPDLTDSAIFVYAIKSGEIVQKLIGEVAQFEFAWSSDSKRIAALSGDCWTYCKGFLTTFDISTGKSLSKADLSRQISLGDQAFYAFCDLKWAPDSFIVSFVSQCQAGDTYNREVHLWDTSSGFHVTATNYTKLPESSQPHYEYGARYEHFWLGPLRLLIGVRVTRFIAGVENSTTATNQSIAYNVADKSTTVFSSDVITELEKNLTSTVVAIHSLTVGPATDQHWLKVGAFDGTIFRAVFTTSNGCKLRWAPDGKYLAYLNDSSLSNANVCPSDAANLVFLQSGNYRVLSYRLPFSTKNPIHLIGWLATQ